MLRNSKQVCKFTNLAILFLSIAIFGYVPQAAASSSPVSKGQQPSRATHDGGIRDVDAIGNRNVGCGRGVGNWYTLDKQIAMGKTYAQQVESTAKLVTDPVITEYVNRLGQNLVRNSDARVPFRSR